MGDSVHVPGSSKNFEVSTNLTNRRSTKCSLVTSSPRLISEKMVKRMVPLKHLGMDGGACRQILLFLVKVAALEGVRRFSKVKCPLMWKVLQGLQVLSYPPFKWLQRWAPFRNLVKGMKIISRPLLLLSVTTAFSDYSEDSKKSFDNAEDSQQHSEPSALQPTSNLRASEEAPEDDVSENWLLQLCSELEMKGVVLPERINDDELRRFYTAANGDFSCLIRSVKKTIRWRETYGILSPQELESWSHLVFWHGYDVKLRPCLIIRLGLACASLSPSERPRFAQAIVSQMEHGVLFLLNEDPQITVLMDCEGLSPFRIPMQVMRSCSTLMQDHYPNRLGTLFVIRLPPVVRVIAQTFIQVLKPTTRKKLNFLGETYQKVLSDFLESVPSVLGGRCLCSKCEQLRASNTRGRSETSDGEPDEDMPEDDSAADTYVATDAAVSGSCEQVLRTAILSILMLWIFLALLVGMRDAEGLRLLAP